MRLTNNGTAESVIIVGKQATWLDRHTAEELRDYIRKISGVTLLIVEENRLATLTGGRILIGRASTNTLIKSFEDTYSVLPAESDIENDCVAIVVRDDVLVISGSNDRSVHYSACHLLQTIFGVGFYFDGDTVPSIPDMEIPEMTLVERSPFKLRHTVGQWVYNFGAFLTAEERCRELDMYAHNKINSYRVYSWNTYFRKKTFQAMGVPTEPINEQDIARRDELRATIEYANSLGIEIMAMLMPLETSVEFRKVYPKARYFGCEWVKDDNAAPETVPYLYPDEPLMKTYVQTAARVWNEVYGPTRNFSIGGPSEHHISTTIDDFINININTNKYVYEALKEIIPDVQIFYDGWGVRANTPPCIWTMPGVMQRFVDELPDEVYFLDLWPNRKETDSTFREPMYRDVNYGPLRKARYVLEPINEFGGDDHMHGDFARHIEAAKEMINPAIVEHGDGFGNCTELCGVSQHFFDLIFQLAWNPKDITVESFIEDTARRRYSFVNAESSIKAMQALEQAVYCDRDSSHARYQKRCYLVRPQRRLVPVEESLQVATLLGQYMALMSSQPDDVKTRFVGRDMFDVMRQYITEYFNMHLRCLFERFLRRNDTDNLHEEFESHAEILEQLLTELEWMTREDSESYVETMVQRYQGRPCDPDVSGSDCYPEDFRSWMRDLGTTFVKTIPNLVDYPSRDYYELIRYYYHPRITTCINTLREYLDDGGATAPLEIDAMLERRYHDVEMHWIEIGYPVTEEYRAIHLPLWKAAENAWRSLNVLPLDQNLTGEGQRSTAEVIDVFASFSENSEQPKERSWVSENPFAE